MAHAPLLAVAMLLLAAGLASARTRVEVSTTATQLSGRLTFTEEEGAQIISDVTMNGTTARSIGKVALSTVGSLTSGRQANCRTNTGEGCQFVPLFPMATRWGSISGMLPTITSILYFVVYRALYTSGLFSERRCLYEGEIGVASIENPVRRVIPLVGRDLISLAEDVLTVGRCRRRRVIGGTLNVAPLVTYVLLER
jgi:hypothetical protein